MSMVKLFTVSLAMTAAITSVMITSMKKKEKKNLSNSPFECGFNKTPTMNNNFSSHYISITILFLIFDLEIVMIMPSPLTQNNSTKNQASILIFMMILTIALMIEWSKGMIEWKT